MDMDEAVLLSYIINVLCMKEAAGEVVDGWMVQGSREVEEALFIQKHTQERILKKLKARGLVFVELKGMPARRCVHLNVDELEACLKNESAVATKVLHQAATGSAVATKVLRQAATDLLQHTTIKESFLTICRESKRDPNTDRCHRRWLFFARSLHQAIKSIRNVDYSRHIQTWADEFRKLHVIEKVPHQKIREVLKWYCKTGIPSKDSYMPIAYSGRQFREKFVRIQAAMVRRRKKKFRDPVGSRAPDISKYQTVERWTPESGTCFECGEKVDAKGMCKKCNLDIWDGYRKE